MQITCPYCGARDAQEYSYLGDATQKRPDPAGADAESAFHDYVYLRDNLSGAQDEYWVHSAGCRHWVRVTRDMRTHEISRVQFACDEGASS